MEKKKLSKKTLFMILGILLLGILTVASTYAYFAWSSTEVNKDATVSVTSVNGLGQCNKMSDNQKILWPVSSRNNGRIVTVSTKQTLSEYASIVWTLTIDSINTQATETAGLKHQSFKYELVNTTTGVSYGSGNFAGLDVGDTITFSNNTENLAYDTSYKFTLYLWIDGTIGTNPSDMTNQTYQFSLVCDITGEGANKVNEIITNPITDFNYEIGTGDAAGYVILKEYTGSSPSVTIPNTYAINGVTYNTALYLRTEPMGNFQPVSTFSSNTTITDVTLPSNYKVYHYSQYDTSEGITSSRMVSFYGCSSLVTAPEIPSTVTIMDKTFYGCTSLVTAPTIPSSVTNMDNAFNNCTSLVTAPTIPSSVTSMNSAFANCTALVNGPTIPSSVTNMYSTFVFCTSLTGTIRINGSNVYGINSAFENTNNPITVEVPAGSATYTNLNNNKPANVTVTTFTPE